MSRIADHRTYALTGAILVLAGALMMVGGAIAGEIHGTSRNPHEPLVILGFLVSLGGAVLVVVCLRSAFRPREPEERLGSRERER